MAEYKNIIDELRNKGLTMVPLNILKKESDTYVMSLMQPSGKVQISDTEVKNHVSNNAVEKFTNFLNNAYESRNQLVITPEYSCPFEVIQNCINNSILPMEGAIWVLGCESISFDSLIEFVNHNSTTEFIYEVPDIRDERYFFSPVCYIFNTKDTSGILKRTIVIQFKTEHMHDTDNELEISHLIKGKIRYWICNDQNSIQLSALMCAEALESNPIPEMEEHKSYLITHLQLNTKPFNPSFAHYRKDLFRSNDNIEIISLNWAKGFQIGENVASSYGGSAIYTKAEKVKLTDERINENHKKGVYYSFENDMKYSIFNLNYNEHVFKLKNYNLLQTSHIPLRQTRLGIETRSTLEWKDSLGWIECLVCNDKWNEYLTPLISISELPLTQSSPIAKERFLSLSSGNIHGNLSWSSPKILDSFNVDRDGICNHFSVYDNITNKEYVRQKIQKVVTLNRDFIITPTIEYPEKFKELYNNCKLVAPEEKSLCQFNVYKENDKFPATFVYAGEISKKEAQEVFDKTSNALECAKRRLVIWYMDSLDGNNKYIYDEKTPKVDEDCSKTSIAIDKED